MDSLALKVPQIPTCNRSIMDISLSDLGRWETNEPLSPSEETSIRVLLSSSENELEEINAKITHAASTPELLEQLELHSTIRRICRVALAPHKRLPLEMLLEIFEQYGSKEVTLPPPRASTAIDDFSIHWNLARVCSWWRRAIFCRPGYWVNFRASGFDDQYRGLYQQAFDRNISSPLPITLSCPFYPLSTNDLTHTIYPNAPRIKSLVLTLRDQECLDFLTHPPGLFHALEDIVLRFEYVPSFPAVKSTVLEGACSLRSVAFQLFPGQYCHSFPHLAFNNLCVPWTQLTKVLMDINISVSAAHLMLSQCESMVHCALRVVNNDSPPPLQCNSIVVVPNLQGLDVYCAGETYSEFLQPLVMPSLKELFFRISAHSEHRDWPGAALLSFIHRSRCSFELWHSRELIPRLVDLEGLLSELPSATSITINPAGGIHIPTINKIGKGILLPWIKHFECAVTLENLKPLLDMLDTRWLDCDPESSGGSLTSAVVIIVECYAPIPANVHQQVEILQERYKSEGRAIEIRMG
jgi:hypothetical protein